MRLFIIALLGILTFAAVPKSASAADPEGIVQYCQEKLNKRGNYHCDCVAEKYYPKKAELEQAWGVPIQDPDVALMHVIAGCTNVEETGNYEYKTCMQSPTFRTSKDEFGADRFCRCYADEWEKELSAYVAIANNTINSKIRRHLKGNARATCKRKFR